MAGLFTSPVFTIPTYAYHPIGHPVVHLITLIIILALSQYVAMY